MRNRTPSTKPTRRLGHVLALSLAVSAVDGVASDTARTDADRFAEIAGLRAAVRADGFEVSPASGDWVVRASPSRWGCDGDLTDVERVAPEVQRGHATYRRAGFDEWYVAKPLGIEQGFTVHAPPRCRGAGGTGVVLELGRGVDAIVAADRKKATIRDASGRSVMRYADLHVIDASGRDLPAELSADAGRLAIRFDDSDAAYPVTVDPLIGVQQSKLVPNVATANSAFGHSVAVSRNTALIGDWASGTAYVFVRSGASWTQQATLTPSVLTSDFAVSVALSGDTALVGTSGSNTAYVFVRVNGMWSQQAVLSTPDITTSGSFGASVALSGDTALVAALAADDPSIRGSVFVFTRSGASWLQTQTLTASGSISVDGFGTAMAIEGHTAVIGAPGLDLLNKEVYVFERSGSMWSERQKLVPDDPGSDEGFGISVALSGDTMLVGAPNKTSPHLVAYVFARAASSWTKQTYLTLPRAQPMGGFSQTTALSGDHALFGAPTAEIAYEFVRSSGVWSEPVPLRANEATSGFGQAVAVDGDIAVVSAPKSVAAFVFDLENKPEATIDLSCRFTANGGATQAAWLGAIALLALLRRRVSR